MAKLEGWSCPTHVQQLMRKCCLNPMAEVGRELRTARRSCPGVDGRSTWVRRARDVQAQLVWDHGGSGVVSTAETLLMRRAAILEAELERFEGIFAAAGEADAAQLNLYQTCANTQRRLLEAIGLERRARDVTPNLDQYTALRQDFTESAGKSGGAEAGEPCR